MGEPVVGDPEMVMVVVYDLQMVLNKGTICRWRGWRWETVAAGSGGAGDADGVEEWSEMQMVLKKDGRESGGGLTATDVFGVEWIQTGVIHFGMTVSYFGFVSDVLELSERHQKRFGPLRYFVAGVLKFICLPKYSYELEYLPAASKGKNDLANKLDVVDLYTDIVMKRSNTPRASSLSSIDSIMTPMDTTCNYTLKQDPTRSSWGNLGANDKEEDISSTMSDPGPIWEMENPPESGERRENWVVKKGKFLGILVCNHSCKTVQSLSSQVVAPKAEHDDNTMDLLLVHGSGRLRLLRFFFLLQMGRHLSLPYVEYVKVKSVKLKPGKSTHSGCGIDGELFKISGQVISSLLPDQCRLIGRPPSSNVK